MQLALNNRKADERNVENEYRSILIAVQLTIVAKDLNLRKEKIVVMIITYYNQYHDYFGSQSKKLTSAAAALPWMVCSEPRLGSSPQWSTTEETWHEVDEDFDQDDHDDWGFWSFWPFRFGLFAFNSLHISLHKPNIRNGFPSFEWNESSFIRPWVKKLSQYTANAHQPRQ